MEINEVIWLAASAGSVVLGYIAGIARTRIQKPTITEDQLDMIDEALEAYGDWGPANPQALALMAQLVKQLRVVPSPQPDATDAENPQALRTAPAATSGHWQFCTCHRYNDFAASAKSDHDSTCGVQPDGILWPLWVTA